MLVIADDDLIIVLFTGQSALSSRLRASDLHCSVIVFCRIIFYIFICSSLSRNEKVNWLFIHISWFKIFELDSAIR